MVIINNVNTYPFNMAGENPAINIPAVMVSTSDGNTIKQNINSTLASLSFDASKNDMLSSFSVAAQQCNRVQSPFFLLKEDTAISMLVNFGIKGITTGSLLYDRANIGLFNGSDRITITPDGGETYNSNLEVTPLVTCPAPGDSGWRENTGPNFKEVVFSAESLRDSGMLGQMVQLDIALATGKLSFGSFFSVQRIELQNVGILMEDQGSGSMCPKPSAAPSITPSKEPTISPSIQPTSNPSASPSAEPTATPSRQPSASPLNEPTVRSSSPYSASPIDILRAGNVSDAPDASDGNYTRTNTFAFFVTVVFGLLTFLA